MKITFFLKNNKFKNKKNKLKKKLINYQLNDFLMDQNFLLIFKNKKKNFKNLNLKKI
jgi:hypothetical protein